MIITHFYLSIYLIAIAFIAWKSARDGNDKDFMNKSKSLSAWESTWTTFASLLSGYNFVLGVTFAYLYGFWYMMAFIGAGVAFITLYFIFQRRLVLLQGGHNLFSVGDFFGIDYGASTKLFVNTISCVALFLFLTLQMFVNTGLFSKLLGIGQLASLLLTVGVVCAYLLIGGFRASIRTDIFNGFVMLPIILTALVFPSHFSWEKLPSAFNPSQIGFAVGLATMQFLSLLAQPESFQRIFASKDSRALKIGLGRSFILILLAAGSVGYLGINFKFSGISVDPSNLFVEGVLGALPPWLAPLLTVSLIAAFMGTIDSSAFALGVLLTGTRGNPSAGTVRQTRFYTFLGIAASAFCSLYLFSFLSSVFALISLISIIGTGFLISITFAKVDTFEINAFLVVGTATYLLGLMLKFVTDNPLTSLIPSAAGLVVFALLRARRKIGAN